MNDQPPLDFEQETLPSQRRLRGFIIHMAAFVILMIGLGVLNFVLTPTDLWVVYPLVFWGGPLAIHAAYAMGLFSVAKPH